MSVPKDAAPKTRKSWWTDFHADRPIDVKEYVFYWAKDSHRAGNVVRNPYTWKLYAKKNKEDAWSEIAGERTFVADYDGPNPFQCVFPVDKKETYQYFRLMIFQTEKMDRGMQLAEIGFRGADGQEYAASVFSSGNWYFIIGGGVLVVALVAIAIVINRKRKSVVRESDETKE